MKTPGIQISYDQICQRVASACEIKVYPYGFLIPIALNIEKYWSFRNKLKFYFGNQKAIFQFMSFLPCKMEMKYGQFSQFSIFFLTTFNNMWDPIFIFRVDEKNLSIYYLSAKIININENE